MELPVMVEPLWELWLCEGTGRSLQFPGIFGEGFRSALNADLQFPEFPGKKSWLLNRFGNCSSVKGTAP